MASQLLSAPCNCPHSRSASARRRSEPTQVMGPDDRERREGPGATTSYMGGKGMGTAIHDDLFAPDVIADPYGYFNRLRAEDPVHWNAKYELWVFTRYDDIVWLVRHPELFSSEVFQRDPRPPYPPIPETDMELYASVRTFFGDFFIQHDRPEHTEMRKVVHGY